MKRNIFRRVVLVVVAFLLGMTPLMAAGQRASALSEDEKYTDVVFHAGDEGYFGTPDVKDIAVRQRRGDIVRNVPEVTTVDPDMVLDGWKLSPDDTYTIDVNNANVSMTGGNLYATYVRGYEVTYQANNGNVIVDGTPVSGSYAMSYMPGEHFDVLDGAIHNDSADYEFDGWYASVGSDRVLYDENTAIDRPNITVMADWKIKDSGPEELEQDVAHEAELVDHSRLFKFTPATDGWYNVYTSGKDPYEDRSITLFMMNADAENLKNSELVSGQEVMGDVHISYYMTGGVTYYFSLQEYGGREVSNITLTASPVETANVTLYIRESERGQAWFDGNVDKLEKTVEIPVGDNTYYYSDADFGVTTSDGEQYLSFYKWETPEGDIDVYITSDINLYADYVKTDMTVFDANGGTFPTRDSVETIAVPAYTDGRPLTSPAMPQLGDGTGLLFAGWSRDPSAATPDADILDGITPASEFACETLYAVYAEPVLVTYRVPDEMWFFVNRDMKQYETLVGKGAIFGGIGVDTDVPGLINAGWVDQDGDFITAGDGTQEYHFDKDTTLDAAAGQYVYVDANPDAGGYIVDPASSAWISWKNVPLANSKPISYNIIKALVGKPQNSDSLKYFKGWATTPDAVEPDIIDGVTPSADFADESIYAVWGEDAYYFESGAGLTWHRGSADGHQVVVRREHDDEETFANFTGIAIDGTDMTSRQEEVYDAEKGSLVLTLRPEYLETLENGEHELTIFFSGYNMTTTFAVADAGGDSDVEPAPDSGEDGEGGYPAVPDTGANTRNGGGAAGFGASHTVAAICIGVMVSSMVFAGYLVKRYLAVK